MNLVPDDDDLFAHLESSGWDVDVSDVETVVVPRMSDLDALPASTAGKVEIETLGEGDDGRSSTGS